MTMVTPRSPLSPRDAARLTGLGRSTIMRAISAGKLEARRDNRNQWQIERDALDRWQGDRDGPARTMPMGHHGPDHGQGDGHPAVTPDAARDLAVAQAIIGQLEARLTEAEARRIATETDRDHWRAQAETLAARLAEPPPRRRWWPWSK